MSSDPIIPGAKLIEQGLAALPSQARLEVEIRELRSQMTILKRENEELKAQIARLTPPTGVDAEAAQVLFRLSNGGGELTCYQISDASGIGLERVKRHLGYLRKLKFAQWSRAQTDDSDPPHRITNAGSEFLYQHGML